MKPSEEPAFAANIDPAVAPFLSILRDAGRERERLALEVGSEVAKELNPFFAGHLGYGGWLHHRPRILQMAAPEAGGGPAEAAAFSENQTAEDRKPSYRFHSGLNQGVCGSG